MMTGTLDDVLETLRNHESGLRRLGVSHAAVFGSVARSEARTDSDIDVLVELDPDQPMGILECPPIKIFLHEFPVGRGNVVTPRPLNPLLRGGLPGGAGFPF